mmetsp:Transcript_41224/g.66856  ORF Transcript_41224/g.66856 Transcript_41224/m.66856 type:complete len:214 (-) Transcript_41224:123-764(-)
MVSLEANDWIFLQIRHVDLAALLGVLAKQHPANVRVEQPSLGIVRVPVSVNKAMVGPMIASPPNDGSLSARSAHQHQQDFHGQYGIVALVRPVPMVPCCDSKSAEEEIKNGEHKCCRLDLWGIQVAIQRANVYGEKIERVEGTKSLTPWALCDRACYGKVQHLHVDSRRTHGRKCREIGLALGVDLPMCALLWLSATNVISGPLCMGIQENVD